MLTIPYKWQRLLQRRPSSRSSRGSTSPCRSRSSRELYASACPDFRRAYDADGMTVDEFDSYGATVRTLRAFIASYQELVGEDPRRHAPEPGLPVAPRRNRVTPLGELVADPSRGLVYGNRGCLHDADGRIRRRFAGRRWIACRLEFRGRRRTR